MPTAQFAEDLIAKHVEGNKYTRDVGPIHRMDKNVFGGFAASLATSTAVHHVKDSMGRPGDQHITAVHSQYLRPIGPGQLTLEVQELKVGKAIVTLRVLISQKDDSKFTADVTIVSASANRGISVKEVGKLSPIPSPVDLKKLETNSDPRWVLYHIPYHDNSMVKPASQWNQYLETGGLQDPRTHDAWFCSAFPEKRITNELLPYLADSFRRVVENFLPDNDFSHASIVERAKRSVNGAVRQEDLNKAEMKIWTATQSSTLDIVGRLPDGGAKWVMMRARGRVVKDGKMVTEVTLLDENLELLAVGQVVDLIVPVDRAFGGSKSKGGGVRIMSVM